VDLSDLATYSAEFLTTEVRATLMMKSDIFQDTRGVAGEDIDEATTANRKGNGGGSESQQTANSLTCSMFGRKHCNRFPKE